MLARAAARSRQSFTQCRRHLSTRHPTYADAPLRRPLFSKKAEFPSRAFIGVCALALGLYVYDACRPQQAHCEAATTKLPIAGLPGTNQERTFIAIKPDGVQRALIAKIIERFEQKGFKLVAMRLVRPTKEMAEGHYADLAGRPFFPGLVKFFSSGPVIAMVWEGKYVIKTGRQMLGETDPAKSLPGSIRGDFSIELGRNICHGSDSADAAAHEIAFWFKPDQVYDWTDSKQTWVYEK